ncbi:MAG: FkbM family methyltransferase [Armatimonadetes bacterium]|nr:FkbM family methyltransferase [Armatimonadota bacterium]
MRAHPDRDQTTGAGQVLTRLPLPLRIARWWSVSGPRRGRWRVWEMAAGLSGRGRLFRATLHYGATVVLDLSDPMSRYPIAYGGMPEPALYRAITRVLSPGDTFLDIGANFGYYSLLAALLVGSTGAVHAFEPQPGVAELLRRNARDNNLPQLVVHQTALGDETGTFTLYVPHRGQSGLATLRPDADWLASRPADAIEVPVARLDDIARRMNGTRVRAVKIDAEGYELPILRGAAELLEHHKPIVFFEAGGNESGDPRALLAEFGYELFRLTDAGAVAVTPDARLAEQQNLCALDPDRHGPPGELLPSGGEVAS